MKSLKKVQSYLLAECFNKLFIGGQFVDPIDGGKFPTYYPATGELLHELPQGKANDVEEAISAAENAWAEGIGEIITPIHDLPSQQFVIIKPDCFISTQALFSQKSLTRNTKPSKFAAYQQNPSLFGNNFEPLARELYPPVNEAFQYLNQYGQAKLTGTGACVFLEFTHDVQTIGVDVQAIADNAPFQAYLAKTLNTSPVFDYIRADSSDSRSLI